MTVDPSDLQRLLSFLELSAFHHDWSVTQAPLDCSVEFACNLTRLTRSRYEGQGEESRKGFQTLVNPSESPNETQTGVDFATRVALLLRDQLAFVGAHGKENYKEEPAKFKKQARRGGLRGLVNIRLRVQNEMSRKSEHIRVYLATAIVRRGQVTTALWFA